MNNPRHATLLLLLASSFALAPAGARAQTVTSPSSIQVDGVIQAVVRDAAGRTIVGGGFNSAGSPATPRRNLARFNADGSLDTTWNPMPDDTVWALALDPSGNVILGGQFRSVSGVARGGIAKVSPGGAVDANWNPNASATVYALATDTSGNVYAGGDFTAIGGQQLRFRIARLSIASGAADPAWNPGADGTVRDMALSGSGHIYVGGNFRSIGGQARERLAKLSTSGTGAADATWNPGANGFVVDLALDAGGNVLVGGSFSLVGGLTRRNVAKVSSSGSVDAAWNPDATGGQGVFVLFPDASGNVYVGGSFTSIGGVARNNVARLSASGSGVVDATWNPNPGPNSFAAIFSLSLDAGGNVCIGGQYTSIAGTARSGYACVTRTSPTVLPPACTLTATPSTFASGTATTVTLVASCTNSPSSYVWCTSPNAPCDQGSGSRTVSYPASTPAGTYTHRVEASNAAGTGIATATVTITPAVQPPTCTLTATPASLTAGTATTVTLSASCTNSPSTFIWSAGVGAPAVSGSGSTTTASFPASTPAGTYAYAVTATNSGGAGVTASATVTVNAAATAPVCVMNAPLYLVANQQPGTLSATCTPAATSYVWTGGTCANTTGPNCVVSPAETTNYSVAGRNSGGTGPADRRTVVVTRQAFSMSVTSNVTQTTSSATAQIQVRPQDVGATMSIYVFAHVPASRLSAALASEAAKADGPDPCVLAQLLSNGQLVGVTYSSMQAFLTGALSGQSQSVNILNNVPTPNVAGGTFYVGYGPSATLMFSNGTFQGAITIPGATQCNTTLLSASPARNADALTGLWWNSSESGWGVHFTQRHGVLFAAMYTYDGAGNPKWYVAPSCNTGAASATTGTCQGLLYEVAGPAFFGTPFNPTAVRTTQVGSLQVNFQNANNASMTYSVNTQSRTVPVTRQLFGPVMAPPAIDYTDLWWNPDESGWGLALTQQYGVMFLAWYVYDGSGRPVWYVAPNCVVSGSACSGDLYRTTGPPAGPTFDASRVQAFPAGTVDVSFVDANNAVLTYTVNGIREVKFIRRQEF